MPSIFGKSGSTTGRAKPGRKSIRGTISGPIPISSTLGEEEFPMRNAAPTTAVTIPDDEIPTWKQGHPVGTPLPPEEPAPSSQDQGEAEANQELPEQQSQLPRDGEDSHSATNERDQEQGARLDTTAETPVSIGGSGGSRTDLARDSQPEPPSSPPPPPPTGPSPPTGSPASRVASHATSRPKSPSHPYRSSPRRSSPLGASPSRVSPPARRATNPALSAARYSMISDSNSKKTNQSIDSPQRKKSTLRSALGRLFGRGRKKNGTGDPNPNARPGRDADPLSPPQHRSDPTALSRPGQRSPKRSASVPINELDRPLRSHSIGPDDIMAIESARNSLQAEATGSGSSTAAGARRRAATTSRMFLRPQLRNREWGAGLSPRPASAHGRGSRLSGRADPEDPNEIGRAITSDSGSGLRRRSRSLSGLQDLTGARPAGRRRSDEIRYWRESYDPGFMSPMSSNVQEDIDDTGMADMSPPESPKAEAPPKTPPQPFNFGLLSKEMIGMKITHAANMDARLDNLESRTLTLEGVVDQLCHAIPGTRKPVSGSSRQQTEPLFRKESHPSFAFTTGVPPPIPAIYHPLPTDSKEIARPGSSRRSLETDTHSQVSFGEAPTFVGSLRPPSSPAPKPRPSAEASPAPSQVGRPSSNSTVRGASSMPTMGREADGASKEDLVTQLRKELEAEREARRALESQVKKLTDRLKSLSTTVYAMVRGPSESRSYERLAPSASQPSPRFVASSSLLVSQQPQEQRSVFETDEDDDEGTDAIAKNQGTKTDPREEGELTEDDFQTPREDWPNPLAYGAFGEELRPDDDEDDDNEGDEDDPKRKKAARTLSLSQLTLGKGQRVRI